jgi:hypothetical protein
MNMHNAVEWLFPESECAFHFSDAFGITIETNNVDKVPDKIISGETVGETVGEIVGETVGEILKYIKMKPEITRKELAGKTGLSVRGIESEKIERKKHDQTERTHKRRLLANN